MNKPELVADVVTTWRRLGENRPTLCFAVNRPHAKALQARFQGAGIQAGYIDAYTSQEDRKAIRIAFHDGSLPVVCNVGVLTTGVDWDVRCLILARPTRSDILFTQIVGRGLRTAEGKADCLILDHSDTHLRLGFVTDIHHARLDDGRKRAPAGRKPKEALPKECPTCSFLKPAKVVTCPSCGFRPERQSKVICEPGELVELRGRRGMARMPAEVLFGQLAWIGSERGFKPGWVVAKYREATGRWPQNKQAPLIQPSAEVLSWVKSTQIRWAKGKGARHAAA